MVFSSLLFLFRFLPLVLLIYYLAPKKARNLVLFLSSLVFYAWGEPVYVVLILFSTIVDYTAGRLVHRWNVCGRKNFAKCTVFASAFVNLALLGFFKYGNFFLQAAQKFVPFELPELDLALPIGISFYTFQTMSYTIDVYRGDAEVQTNFISFGTYVSLFPQLIAGPIIRYKTVAKQINERRENTVLFYHGIMRFMAGLGKKVLLANHAGTLWKEAAALSGPDLTTGTAWLGLLAFTLQIYFDFSGYSDMAIGLGSMFGFSFPENFRYPYESKSVTEFWRRWHISLGTWFKEYVYIPLGGNRKGVPRQIFNLTVVWFLTGLWHGASWNFVLWGIYYGILLIIEKFVLQKILIKLPSFVRHLYTMAAVMIGWSLFSWLDMADYTGYTKALFFRAAGGLANEQTMYLLLTYGLFLLCAIIGSISFLKKAAEKYLPDGTLRKEAACLLFIIFIFVTCVAMLVNSSYNPFLYFRF